MSSWIEATCLESLRRKTSVQFVTALLLSTMDHWVQVNVQNVKLFQVLIFPFYPRGGLDSMLGAEQLHVHSQTQSQGNIPLDNIFSPATTTTSDIPVNNVFTQSSSNFIGSGVAMLQDMGAAILYQMQQLNITSGALSMPGANKLFLQMCLQYHV